VLGELIELRDRIGSAVELVEALVAAGLLVDGPEEPQERPATVPGMRNGAPKRFCSMRCRQRTHKAAARATAREAERAARELLPDQVARPLPECGARCSRPLLAGQVSAATSGPHPSPGALACSLSASSIARLKAA
jgi:hypothetical protein